MPVEADRSRCTGGAQATKRWRARRRSLTETRWIMRNNPQLSPCAQPRAQRAHLVDGMPRHSSATAPPKEAAVLLRLISLLARIALLHVDLSTTDTDVTEFRLRRDGSSPLCRSTHVLGNRHHRRRMLRGSHHPPSCRPASPARSAAGAARVYNHDTGWCLLTPVTALNNATVRGHRAVSAEATTPPSGLIVTYTRMADAPPTRERMYRSPGRST